MIRRDRQIAGEGAERKLVFAVKRSARFAIKALSPLDISVVELEFFFFMFKVLKTRINTCKNICIMFKEICRF